ncbi:unnamed protein product, partial [Nesidiocoris tenuis]
MPKDNFEIQNRILGQPRAFGTHVLTRSSLLHGAARNSTYTKLTKGTYLNIQMKSPWMSVLSNELETGPLTISLYRKEQKTNGLDWTSKKNAVPSRSIRKRSTLLRCLGVTPGRGKEVGKLQICFTTVVFTSDFNVKVSLVMAPTHIKNNPKQLHTLWKFWEGGQKRGSSHFLRPTENSDLDLRYVKVEEALLKYVQEHWYTWMSGSVVQGCHAAALDEIHQFGHG